MLHHRWLWGSVVVCYALTLSYLLGHDGIVLALIGGV
jgi:hypothetical protein